MSPLRATLCLVLCAAPALADDPAWVAGWLEASLPPRSPDAEHRQVFLERGELPASWASSRVRTLRLEVVAAETGEPLPEVLLSSWQGRQQGFTDAEGALGPGPWYVGADGAAFVQASAPGRRSSAGWVRLDAPVVRLALARDTRRRVELQVQDPSGAPAPATTWVLQAAEPAVPAAPEGTTLLRYEPDPPRGRSGPDGKVLLRVQGEASLRLSLPNTGAFAGPVPPASGPWQVALDPEVGEVVAGVVQAPDGSPLPASTLADARSGATLVADAAGRFRFTNCLPGLYCFVVLGPDAEEATDVTAFSYPGQPREALVVVAR
ncbi:MAG: hypothetical protein R3F62_24125 [Planctomycetota bacterium]